MDNFAEGSCLELSSAERAAYEAVEGTVFDIQRYSLHDGPGLRTNVFFKGCPLRCDWCSNPESQQMAPEIAVFEVNCIRCGQFDEPCPELWRPRDEGGCPSVLLARAAAPVRPARSRAPGSGELRGSGSSPSLPDPGSPGSGTGGLRRAGRGEKHALLAEFRARADACPACGVRWIGQRRSAAAIMAEVRRDIPFYAGGGGMTLTGGEPLLQPQLAEALLRLAKADCINTAVQTTGSVPWRHIEACLPFSDEILFDLKHMDPEVHRRYTGVDNALILENLRRLNALGAPVILRIPLIPGFNASRESLLAIAAFVSGLGSPARVDLLPYHTLGRSKYAALARDYPWSGYEPLSAEQVAELAGVLEASGLSVTVGG